MYTAYVADTPNGRKLVIALEELELDYRIRHVDLGAGEQFDPAFERLSPNNKIPVLVDEDSGASLFESGAILYHLAVTTGRLIPVDAQGRDRVLQWLFLQAASVGPMLGQLWWFRHRAGAGSEGALERYKAETGRLYRLIERRLGETAHIADEDYTVADISFHPWLASHEELGIDIGAYPRVQAWLEAVSARPALARAARRMGER